MRNKNTPFSLSYKILRVGGGAALLLIALCLLFSCDSSAPVKDYEIQGNTYLVYTETGLRVWADAAKSDPSLGCTLQGDITLTTSDANGNTWSPVGSESAPYTGTFDGNGHKITGLKIALDTDYLGFFGYIGSGGAVKNLNLENVNLLNNRSDTNLGFSGAVAGYSKGSIDKCNVSGSVSSQRSYIGGIAGYIDEDTISGCVNRCVISLTSAYSPRVGGIAGAARNANLSGSSNYGSINLEGTGEIYGGGIAGDIAGTTVTSCFNSGNIAGKHNQNSSPSQTPLINLGAIAGMASNSSIAECTVKDGCTITATYNSAYTRDHVNKYVGNVGAGTTVASSNSGEATIIKNGLNSTT